MKAIMDKMSLDDKIGQMAQIEINMLLADNRQELNRTRVDYFIGQLGVGSVFNKPSGVSWSAKDYRKAAILINQVAESYQRPPVIWGLDSVHGANYIQGASIFPQPINMAATFNLSIANHAGKIASRDTRAAGIHWLFSPLLGISMHPGWSRVYETFGEDPFLVGEMAKALVEGIQTQETNGGIPSRAAACAKHWLGYSFPHNGHDRAPSWIPTRHLYQYFVPPWKKVLDKVMTVMESYTETDGVPNVANPDALNYLLRQRLGFRGVLVTDYAEIYNLATWHGIVETPKDAVMYALSQGSVDMSMIPWDTGSFYDGVQTAVRQNIIPQGRIDTSVERILRLKENLCMLDEKIVEEDPNLALVGTDRNLVLDMARQSIILAKNDEKVLPLQGASKVLVTGPTAHSIRLQSGGWTGEWQGADSEKWFTYGTTVLDAFQANKMWTVSFSCGVSITGGECNDEKVKQGVIEQVEDWVGLGPSDSIDRAVKASSDVDTIVVCIGEQTYAEKPGDASSMKLPDGHYELVKRLRDNSHANLVLVYFGGRPKLLKEMVDQSDAIIIAFLPGPDGGQAIADAVNGSLNPSGRMPITFPKFEDAGGIPYFHSVSDRCNTESGLCDVEWKFGHGMSYTSFKYSKFSSSGGIDGDLKLSVTVENTGLVGGSETVMFFTFDQTRSTTPEYKRLRAFEKITLEAGQTTTVNTIIPAEELKFVGPNDDKHYISGSNRNVWVSVGIDTDCRIAPTDDLCLPLGAPRRPDKHIYACDEACDIWERSGCMGSFFDGKAPKEACIDLCTLSNNPDSPAGVNEGWGWNYVNCLESVVWGLEFSTAKTKHCWKMSSLCRDIFHTGRMDQYGLGDEDLSPYAPNFQNDVIPISHFTALIAGLVSVVLIGLNFRRKIQTNPNDVEFTRVSTDIE